MKSIIEIFKRIGKALKGFKDFISFDGEFLDEFPMHGDSREELDEEGLVTRSSTLKIAKIME